MTDRLASLIRRACAAGYGLELHDLANHAVNRVHASVRLGLTVQVGPNASIGDGGYGDDDDDG